jgi:glycosyltransferase involved in cell wall biosynthesis
VNGDIDGGHGRGGDSPLRVLEIIGNAIVGGMETAVLRLVQALPRDAFRITALCPFASPFTERLGAVVGPVHVSPIGEDLPWHTIQMAVELVRRERIDVIHAHLWKAHIAAAVVGRLTATPVLATVHGMHMTMGDLEAHLVGRTHACMVSEAARAHALAVGAVDARLHVVRNGVDDDVFRPRTRVPGGPLTVGYVGRLSPEKDPYTFIEAAARVHAKAPGVRFTIVGDGPLRDELTARVHALRLDGVVSFEGVVEDMPAVYAGLDVLALTSRHEGTPLVVLEAMACGVPIVATSVGGVPELLSADETGVLVAPGEPAAVAHALLALLDERWRREAMGVAARARAVARFALRAHVASTAALLQAVAADRAPAARPRGGMHVVDTARARAGAAR